MVSTIIHIITIWLSLFPTSFAGITIDKVYTLLSRKGIIPVYHVPLIKHYRVRCLLSTDELFFFGYECLILTYIPTHIAFWLQCISHFHCSRRNGLYHRFTYVHHTDSLALTRLMADRRKQFSRLASQRLSI